MTLEGLVFPELNSSFVVSALEIVLIDIVLAGDNALLIAMAVKSLPQRQRLFGIVFGAGLAVLLRVVLTFFAAQLMIVSYVRLIGGLLIFWIACKLLIQDGASLKPGREATTLWQAVWIILVADVTMSLDNILALAGASRGNVILLLFGLILSIPLVVFASSLMSKLMDRYPIIVYLGAAVLGSVAVELIFTDRVVLEHIQMRDSVLYGLKALGAALVIVAAKYIKWRRSQDIGKKKENGAKECEGRHQCDA